MIFLEQTLAILWKDIRCELRSKQTWMGMGMFALLVLVIFNFAFDLRVDNKAAIAPGALWVAFVFASLLGLGRTITAEREKGLMDRLLLCPVDRKAIYLAKLLGNLLFIGVVEVVALPVFAALFNVPLFGALLPIVLLGTLGVAAIGTLFSAMAAATQARGLSLDRARSHRRGARHRRSDGRNAQLTALAGPDDRFRRNIPERLDAHL